MGETLAENTKKNSRTLAIVRDLHCFSRYCWYSLYSQRERACSNLPRFSNHSSITYFDVSSYEVKAVSDHIQDTQSRKNESTIERV